MSSESMIPGILFCAAGIASFFCYDRLVKREYKVANDSWENDERPPGFFSAPPGTSMMRGWTTRNKLYFQWIFTTPAWIADDSVARRLQIQLRLCWMIGLVAWLCALLVILHAF
jgi:hypothetical protein